MSTENSWNGTQTGPEVRQALCPLGFADSLPRDTATET